MNPSRVIADLPPAPVDYTGPVVVVAVIAAVVVALVWFARQRGRH